MGSLERIELILHVNIVRLSISVNSLSDSTPGSSFKHQRHIWVSQEFQSNFGHLEAGLPCQSRRSVEVGRIKTVMS